MKAVAKIGELVKRNLSFTYSGRIAGEGIAVFGGEPICMGD